MTKFTKKITVAILAALTCLGMLTPIFAEEGEPETPTDILGSGETEGGTDNESTEGSEEETGKDSGLLEYDRIPDLTGIDTANLKIRYFDDSDETIPGTGAEYTIMQVGTVGRDVETNGRFLPLDEKMDWSEETDAIAYEERVLEVYKENPEIGYVDTMEIGEDGTALFSQIPVGVYIIRETKTLRYHIRPIPFLVSAPETDESGTTWNLNAVANPKQILAGDIGIAKKAKGSVSSKDNTYHFTVELSCEGEYKAVLPGNKDALIKNGDVIELKAGQSASIMDIPAGTTFTVTEKEANQGYQTTYYNPDGSTSSSGKCEGIVEAKKSADVSVMNDSTDLDMGVSNMPMFWIFGGLCGVTILGFFLLFVHKKDDKDGNAQGIASSSQNEKEK